MNGTMLEVPQFSKKVSMLTQITTRFFIKCCFSGPGWIFVFFCRFKAENILVRAYGPISVLPVVSEVIDRVVFKHLCGYLNEQPFNGITRSELRPIFFTTSTHRVNGFDQSFFGGKYFYMYLYTLEPWRLQIGVCALFTLEIGLPQLCSVTEMAPITLLRVNTTHASSLQSVHYRCVTVCLYFVGREGVVLRFFVGFDWLATQARLIRGCF